MTDIFQVRDDVDTQFLDVCAHGHAAALNTLRWLKCLSWPSQEEGPLQHSTGTSWIELSLSWMLYNSEYLPVTRAAASEGKRVVIPANWQRAKEWQITYAEFGTALSMLVDHVVALTPQMIVPTMHRRKCKSLYLQGCIRHTQGINGRVQFPCQPEVAAMIAALFRDNANGHMLQCPKIPSEGTSDVLLPDSFSQRTLLAKKRMFSVRARRRALSSDIS